MKRPKVSIIIPNYNNAKYLPACLDSVQAQAFDDMEILVIDDCSSDGSERVIRSYAARDPRISYYKMNKNSGVGAVRNFGMDTAAGEYVFFLDSDDLIVPGTITDQVRIAESLEADIVVGQFTKVSEQFQIPDDCPTKTGFSFVSFENAHDVVWAINDLNLVTVWGKLYRREMLEDLRFDTEIYPYEDVEFMLRLYPRMKIGATSGHASVFYRMSETSVIRDLDRDISNDVVMAMNSLLHFMLGNQGKIHAKYIRFLKKYCFEFMRLYIMKIKDKLHECHDKARRKKLKIMLLNVAEFVRAAHPTGLFRNLGIKKREKFGMWLFGQGFVITGAKLLARVDGY
ncbi:MAG: glycosyltransferase family 2 protein [Rickettsiales bacterium]|jgi:glycosyltransferase involved in cell wall biosynthesis|nr:glycosyltransferase family 2 protein [Rickettsiales bacterium]